MMALIDRVRRRCSMLGRDHEGVTVVEFAFAAPILILTLVGIVDVGHAVYARAVLQGAIQKAGRDAGLETGAANLEAIDAFVLSQVQTVVPHGAILSSRRNYQSFDDVGSPEDFVDANSNGSYDDNECFTDVNNNAHWDEDRAAAGLGGADDVVLYTATLTYDRITPLWHMIGLSKEASISASTTLRNQPFGDQATRIEVQICPE